MEFLDPKQKRAHKIRLYIGYGLMAVLVIAATWLLTSLSYGYYYDPKTNTVVQNGLVFVDAHPESARVFVNGQDKGITDVRLVLPAANYKIELKRDGYRTWSHDALLGGGQIERIIYPFLFPQTLVTEDAQLFASKPIMTSQSPDRRWLIIKHPEKLNEFEVIDIESKNTESQSVAIDQTVLHQAGAVHDFKEVEWSTDNKHLLIKHSFDGGAEYVIFDRENPAGAVNLNTRFKRPITAIRLHDKKYDRYYIHDKTSGDLVTAELASSNVASVASNVLQFQPHGAGIVLYVSNKSVTKGTVSVNVLDDGQDHLLRELPKDSKYLIDLAQFNNIWHIAVGASNDKKVYVYIDPLKDLKRENKREPLATVLLRLEYPIEHVSFSANTRFIAAQSGSSFAVYDAEKARQFRFDTKLGLPANYEAKWMDGHRLVAVDQNFMTVFDFDGTNMQKLVKTDSAFYPFFDRDYNTLFTISSSATVKDKTALARTSMLVKKN